ncbi:MAG: hypothetical protein ACO2O2_03375 [Acidilobaceae archaeon]
MRRELLEAKAKEILEESLREVLELEVGGSKSIIISTGSYELTFRCNREGRCEVMLRYADNPAVTCTTRCYEDPASSLDRGLLEELKARVETLIGSLGVKLLNPEDLG